MNARLRLSQIVPAVLVALALASSAHAISIETVVVGNAGNPADFSRVMNDGATGYGSVGYEYRIGKFEVTNDQYAAYLNAIASASDPHEIYEPFMGSTYHGGITRSGGPIDFTYTVKPNMGNKPVEYIHTATAMRFANWLHNGQPSGGQNAGTTENGAYDLTGASLPQTRTAGATWFIPNDNEWYKAAYYDPRDTGSGGPAGNSHYWQYATRSSLTPTAATANVVGDIANPGANVVNWNLSANWNGSAPFGNFTSVGSAGPLSASYYGTFDQSGNVFEYNENTTVPGGQNRTIRGGDYTKVNPYDISAELRAHCGGCYAGLRMASIINPPDPNGGLLAHWNAENGATDVTGNGHDGTFFGNATTATSGPFGKAFTFDGSGDYISIGNELDMGTSNFTLSAWIKGDPTMNQWGRIFDKGFASAYSLHRRDFSNQVGFEMQFSGNFFGTTTQIIDNTWHHVALVKNGTTVMIYADGDAENSNTVSAASQNNSLPLLIGFNPGEGIQGYWKGLLDELKIFGRALSAAEVAALAINPAGDLPGDYNDNGLVDAADYILWRNYLGTNTTLPNDTTSGSVQSEDYTVWRSHFGQTATGAALLAAVPEPECTWLFALAAAAIRRRLRRGRARI